MNTTSLRRAIIPVSILSLLAFLGRAFYDFRFEAPKQSDNQMMLYTAIAYLVFVGVWVWAILGAQNQRRAALIALIILNVLLNVVFGIATLIIFCPPGCVPFPMGYFWNTAQLVLGVLSVILIGWSMAQSGARAASS